MLTGEFEASAPILDRARELNPNLAVAFEMSGILENWLGHTDKAIEHLLILDQLAAQRLQRHDLVELCVARLVDAAHPSGAHEAKDLEFLDKGLAIEVY